MTWTIFLVATLATYRMGRMVALEDGPFDVFRTIRGMFDPDQATWIGRGLNCPLCVSFWAALPVTIILGVLGYVDRWFVFVVWMGLAGGACLLYKWESKR